MKNKKAHKLKLKTPSAMKLYQRDLPKDVDFGESVAVDTETMGLQLQRDRLCLVQLCDAERKCYMVQIAKGQKTAPNLQKIMEDPKVLKIFHFARFDIATMLYYLNIKTSPVYCTRTASKLVRTYTDKHGLRTLCNEFLKIDIDKQKQSSNWGAKSLSQAQLSYAASDVLHLHSIMEEMNNRLEREERTELAQRCFECLPTQALLDASGFGGADLFAH